MKRTEPTDLQLVEMALEADQSAFSLLLCRYRDSLIKHIQNFVPVLADAEDICQRSFEKAFMNISRYNPGYAFSTWLYSIAQNEAIDHLRRTRTTLSPIPLADDPKVLEISVPDTPEEQVIVDQAVVRIITLIGQLPDNYRRVAELRFIKDYAYEDIAEALSLPLGTVKTRISRARALLVRQLEESGHERGF